MTNTKSNDSITQEMPPHLSVVTPVYNEEANINELHKRLTATLKKIKKTYEIIYINDGSRDNSLKKIISLHKKDKHIKIINLSRNFGHMAAVSAGLNFSSGKKIVLLDSDLQDPPEFIENLYKTSLKGFKVVYAIKKKRKEGILKRFLFKSFYRILNTISEYKMPLDAGTFSIMDREVKEVLQKLPEKNKYFSGLRAWAGYSQSGIFYNRAARKAGRSKSLLGLLKLALDGMFSFSYIPLRLASLIGFVFATVAFIFILFVILARIYWGIGIVGWASTLSVILFIGGIQLITLGIIGEYLARVYDEVKRRPDYIVAEKYGFTNQALMASTNKVK